MKVELFPFQKRAIADIRMKTAEAMGSYHRTHAPQVVSFTAPTGAGKTIIMASLIESIFFGDENYAEQPNAIIVWLSDSPQLNEQSKLKIDSKADKIRLSQCVTVSEDSFDKEIFEDGHIYFLNTQKLSASSRLTKNGDDRTYTICRLWRIPCVIRVIGSISSLMKPIVACRDAMPVRLRPSCRNLSKAAIQTRFLLCQLSLVCRLRHSVLMRWLKVRLPQFTKPSLQRMKCGHLAF